MADRITTTEGLKLGDVLLVAVELTDKVTGAPFWWRRFCTVMAVSNARWATLMTLKLHIDPDKDVREVDFSKDVVTPVHEYQMPQGVAAIFMKHVTKGLIKVGDP